MWALFKASRMALMVERLRNVSPNGAWLLWESLKDSLASSSKGRSDLADCLLRAVVFAIDAFAKEGSAWPPEL